MSRILAVIALSAAFPVTTYAADPRIPSPPAAAAQSPFYGKLTLEAATDYIPRGISVSAHQATFKGKIEVGYGMFYGFASVINVSVADTTREVDLVVGVRPMLTPVYLDFGFAHYDFDGSGIQDFSEVYGAVAFGAPVGAPGQSLTFLGKAFVRPDNSNTYFEGNLDYALTKRLALSGRLGSVNTALSYLTYGGALKYNFLPGLVGELRYTASTLTTAQCFGTNLCDGRLMATLTYDVNLTPFFAGHR
jgi:uncharacterized protein (TIGR02001 family)